MRFHVRVGILPHEREHRAAAGDRPASCVTRDDADGVLDYRALYEIAADAWSRRSRSTTSRTSPTRSRSARWRWTDVTRARVAMRKPHVLVGGPLALCRSRSWSATRELSMRVRRARLQPGDRAAHLAQARAALTLAAGTRLVASSSRRRDGAARRHGAGARISTRWSRSRRRSSRRRCSTPLAAHRARARPRARGALGAAHDRPRHRAVRRSRARCTRALVASASGTRATATSGSASSPSSRHCSAARRLMTVARSLVAMPDVGAGVREAARAHRARHRAARRMGRASCGSPPDEARAWHDAGPLHDALRDAPETTLRELAGDVTGLHRRDAARPRRRRAACGATARRATELLDAIR